MTQVSAPRSDAARLAALRRTGLLDTPPDEAFDRLTRLAARLVGAPTAFVSLVDQDRHFFKSSVGLPQPWAARRSLPLSYSFCRYVVSSGEPLVVEDARRDPLVRANPAVRELGWIAYAGVPLTLADGHVVGSLAAVDALPRLWSQRDVSLLRDLAASVVSEIELRCRRPDAADRPLPGAGVFEQSALPMGLVSIEGHWLRVNHALADLLGTTPAALAGCTADEVTHPADRAAEREALRLLLAGECASYTTEKRLLRPDQEPVWVLASVTLLPEDDGVPEHLHVACLDVTARREMEQRLRDQEERYRLAADSALDAVWDWDLLTDRVAWRERPGGPFGYYRSAADTSAAWWYERLHGEERERVVSGIHAAIAAGSGSWSDRYRFRRADGSYADVEVRAAIVRDDGGDAVRMIGAMADATERAATGHLQADERDLLEQIAQGLETGAALERITHFVEANAREVLAALLLADHAARELRLAAGPSLSPELRDLLGGVSMDPPGGPSALAAAQRDAVELPDLAANESASHWRGRFLQHGIRAAGSFPVTGSDGGLLGTLDLYAREPRPLAPSERLAARRAAELAQVAIESGAGRDALARSARLLERVVDALPIGVWMLDREGRTIFSNPAAREVRGGSRQLELSEVGRLRAWRADTGEPMGRDGWAAARAVRRGETVLGEEIVLEGAEGTRKTILDAAVPLRELDGELLGAVCVSQDVSLRRTAEESRRTREESRHQTQKLEAVSRLAGGVAHDFNNLLTGILSFSELVLHQLHRDDPLRADVEQIRAAGERGATLTRQLVAFSRRQALQPEVLSVNDCVARIEPMLRRLLGAERTLVTELDPEAGPVLADPAQLEQALVNLVTNARDAMPHGGVVTIGTANVGTAAGDGVGLSVRDTGLGMDAETRARIFEPFFTTKPRGRGPGLGLAVVHGIVEQSGGRIEVETAPGRGTTFTLLFPRHPAIEEGDGAQRRQTGLLTGSETLLLVEDEAAVRVSARRLLERQGYTVVEACHGADALRISEEHQGRFDLVITDLAMPEMGGRELAEELRAREPGLRVLFISGYSDRTAASNGGFPAGTGFVEKPFTAEQLTRRVRELLEQRNGA